MEISHFVELDKWGEIESGKESFGAGELAPIMRGPTVCSMWNGDCDKLVVAHSSSIKASAEGVPLGIYAYQGARSPQSLAWGDLVQCWSDGS